MNPLGSRSFPQRAGGKEDQRMARSGAQGLWMVWDADEAAKSPAYNLALRAHDLAVDGQTYDAIALCERARKLDPDFGPTYFVYADLLFRVGRHGDAIAAYSHVLDASSGLNESTRLKCWAHVLRAQRLTDLGRHDEAIADCNRALSLRHDESDVAFWLYARISRASAFVAAGRFADAVSEFNLALDLAEHAGQAEAAYFIARGLADCSQQLLNELAESNVQDYNRGLMDAAEAIEAAAVLLSRVFPAERVGKALEDLAAGGERAGTDVSATGEPRPKWEIDRLPGENPAKFAWRAYAAEAEAGTLHRGVISTEDPALHRKLKNWLRTHDMPEGIDIPTLPEWNDRQVEKLAILRDDATVRETVRLAAVVARRRARMPGM
jgi:tetratricopeptide (TPR) repeat protein